MGLGSPGLWLSSKRSLVEPPFWAPIFIAPPLDDPLKSIPGKKEKGSESPLSHWLTYKGLKVINGLFCGIFCILAQLFKAVIDLLPFVLEGIEGLVGGILQILPALFNGLSGFIHGLVKGFPGLFQSIFALLLGILARA